MAMDRVRFNFGHQILLIVTAFGSKSGNVKILDCILVAVCYIPRILLLVPASSLPTCISKDSYNRVYHLQEQTT